MSRLLISVWRRLTGDGVSFLLRHESAALSALHARCTSIAQAKLARQFELYDRAQRSENGKHLLFLDDHSLGNCRNWPSEVLFEDRELQSIATISYQLRQNGSRRKIVCEMFCFGGRLAGIEFDKLPFATLPQDRIAFRQLQLSENPENIADILDFQWNESSAIGNEIRVHPGSE
jgi:hypothetical protein